MTKAVASGHSSGAEVSQAQNMASSQPATPADQVAGRAAALRFEQLYETHFDFVWRTVRYLGVPDASVDDAVQDTFLVAHRRLADFEARSSPRTWLFAIALRVVSDHRRSQRRRGRLHDELRNVAPALPQTPLEQIEKAQARRIVLAALEGLSEDQRAVFVLSELEQMTAPEIMQTLDVNLNTVYSRLRAARREFTKALRAWGQRSVGGEHG
jgi:RNA polymerase sigma-70 factor, ECF subfamily